MTDPWAKFWIAISLMVLAGALIANIAIGSPLEIGALAQWASAVATTVAVWVALRNKTVTLSEGSRREAVREQQQQRAFVASIVGLADQAILVTGELNKYLGKKPRSVSDIARLAKIFHFGSLSGSLEKLPLHSAHTSVLVAAISTLRMAVQSTQAEIDLAIDRGVDTVVHLDEELKVMTGVREALAKAFPDVANEFS